MKIKGSAFLWHQIRCMVAVLFLIGQGLESSDVRDPSRILWFQFYDKVVQSKTMKRVSILHDGATIFSEIMQVVSQSPYVRLKFTGSCFIVLRGYCVRPLGNRRVTRP